MDERQHLRWRLTRQGLLKRGGALGAALTVPGLGDAIWSASAAAAVRGTESLPDPGHPAGTATAAMPFDHIVCVMMENHSFDNLLGALPRLGKPNADGLTFDAAGQATNSNPSSNGTVTSFELTNTEQPGSVDQSWDATHEQIDGGKMDGFVESVNSIQPMGTEPLIKRYKHADEIRRRALPASRLGLSGMPVRSGAGGPGRDVASQLPDARGEVIATAAEHDLRNVPIGTAGSY